MFGRIAKNEKSPLDDTIDRVLDEMVVYGPDAERYPAYLDYLERLTKLKTETRREPISWDTIAIVAGNLAGILIIVSYEHMHVITSKGLGFLLKTKGSATST